MVKLSEGLGVQATKVMPRKNMSKIFILTILTILDADYGSYLSI
jgi:hypothetical protein